MSGDEAQAAFLERLDEHRGILFKVAGAYCRDRLDREDLVQEIVAALWRSYGRFDEKRRFSTWMYRVAVNVAISFGRRAHTRERRVVSAEVAVLEEIAAIPETPDARTEALHEMIAGLRPLDRALVLLYLDDLPYGEIAAILGISESNVGTKLARIKAKLKRDAAHPHLT